MAKRNVKSTDPRKPVIVQLLKKGSGGNKVTLLTEIETNRFRGRCLLYVGPGQGDENTCLGPGSYRNLGDYEVWISFGSDNGELVHAVLSKVTKVITKGDANG